MRKKIQRGGFAAMFLLCLLALAGLSGAADRECGTVEGHFRGRFWHYYERGRSYADCEMWPEAEADFREAIAQREADQVMAKTYGLNFIDYFPHRELGVVLYRQGKTDESLRELERSYGQEPSERAAWYQNQIRREQIQQAGGETTPPEIKLQTPTPGAVTAEFKIEVKGVVKDAGRVLSIAVNGEPVHFDLALPEKPFALEATVPPDGVITVTALDLLGNLNVAKVALKIDREGPQVVIEEVTSPGPGRYLVRGIAVDPSGIAKLKVGKKEINQVAAEIRFSEEVESALGFFAFEATDQAGNRTRGRMSEFNLPRKGAFAPRPPRYAALGMPVPATPPGRDRTFLLAAGAGPEVTVSSVNERQTVYVDRMVVEGMARSTTPITLLSVQDRSILQRPGLQVYFSAIVPLAAGDNKIKVAATDQGRQRSESQVNVRREIAKVHQVSSRYSIAVMPFGGPNAGAANLKIIYDQFLHHLSQLDRFDLLERQKLDLVLAELELSSTSLVDPATSIQAGKLIAASGMLLGEVHAKGNALELVIRLVDTETSQILLSRDAYTEATDLKSLNAMCERLAWKIRQAFPLVEGNVVKVSGRTIYTDLAAANGIVPNMQLIVFKLGEEIRGANGQLLGAETEEKGLAVLVSVEEKMSKAELKPAKTGGQIVPGMKVITR